MGRTAGNPLRELLCFVFDELTEQMGAGNPALARLADEFPNYYKSFSQERGLVINDLEYTRDEVLRFYRNSNICP